MQRNPFHRFDSSDAHSSSQALGEDRFYVNDQKKHFEVNNAADDVEHTIVVDSKQRDPSIYPHPNHFKVYLRSPLTNVVSCDLLSVEFPNVQFVVSPSNQIFEWTETRDDGEDHSLSFSIPTGHYDGPTLAFEILRMMNAKAAVPAYDVQFLPVRGKFLFQVAPSTLSRFRLSFGSNSCSGLLGFGEGTTDWSNEYTNTGVDPDDPTYSGGISSPFYCNLFGDTYVYLSSPELDSNFHELMYNRSLSNPISPAISNAFACLSMFGSPGQITFYSANTATLIKNDFKPPLAKLDQLEFSWLRSDGSLVDFQGVDCSFILRFKCRARSLGAPQFVNRT
jgi:hypothetical protein